MYCPARRSSPSRGSCRSHRAACAPARPSATGCRRGGRARAVFTGVSQIIPSSLGRLVANWMASTSPSFSMVARAAAPATSPSDRVLRHLEPHGGGRKAVEQQADRHPVGSAERDGGLEAGHRSRRAGAASCSRHLVHPQHFLGGGRRLERSCSSSRPHVVAGGPRAAADEDGHLVAKAGVLRRWLFMSSKTVVRRQHTHQVRRFFDGLHEGWCSTFTPRSMTLMPFELMTVATMSLPKSWMSFLTVPRPGAVATLQGFELRQGGAEAF